MRDQESELLDELILNWIQVYKKSATTLVLLRIIQTDGPVDTATVGNALNVATGWEFTERGLYRTLRRLAGLGLIDVAEEPGRRTGAQRNVYQITDRGRRFLEEITSQLVE